MPHCDIIAPSVRLSKRGSQKTGDLGGQLSPQCGFNDLPVPGILNARTRMAATLKGIIERLHHLREKIGPMPDSTQTIRRSRDLGWGETSALAEPHPLSPSPISQPPPPGEGGRI